MLRIIYLATQFSSFPERIRIEPDNRVILRKNIIQNEIDDCIIFTADEVVFTLSYPISESEIDANFDSWWLFGEKNDTDRSEPTMEERLTAIEDVLRILIKGGE